MPINPEKKNGRTRTAAKRRSLMVRCIALKAAGFTAGVAIPTISEIGDDNYPTLTILMEIARQHGRRP
jgi:hypothetical protein